MSDRVLAEVQRKKEDRNTQRHRRCTHAESYFQS